jgi:hypothetical protein
MKQTNLMRWIEAAEARSVCMLAGEDPARLTVVTDRPNTHSIQSVLLKLRGQLCLGEASRRHAGLYRSRRAA